MHHLKLKRTIDIIDGGYITWVHGVSPGGDWGGWSTYRFEYIGHLIAFDDDTLWRRDVYPGYKGRRAERFKEDPIYAAKRLRVREFRELLDEDPQLCTVRLKKMEADDLMAVAYMLHPKGRVVSLDKDMFQVPGMKAAMVSVKSVGVQARAEEHPRFPKYVGNPRQGFEYCLIQSLLGDKSDSVPRILPSHSGQAKRIFAEIRTSRNPLNEAYKRFGDEFLRNLKVILIPGPPLLKNSSSLLRSPRVLFETVLSGDYWDVQNLKPEVVWEVKEMLKLASQASLPMRFLKSRKNI